MLVVEFHDMPTLRNRYVSLDRRRYHKCRLEHKAEVISATHLQNLLSKNEISNPYNQGSPSKPVLKG